MKKVLSLVLAAAMLAVTVLVFSASAIHSPDDTTVVWLNPEIPKAFDTILFRTTDGVQSMTERYGVEDGSAAGVVGANPIYLTNETHIICRGWAGIPGEAEIVKYGYRINGSDPVYDESFTYGAEAAVYEAGGSSRFIVEIPVAGRTAPTLLTVTSLGSDGRVYDIIEFSVNGVYPGDSQDQPGSPFVRTYETAGSGFNVIVDGGASPLKVKAGKSATVNVELDNARSVSYVSLVLSYDPDLTFKGAEFPIKASGDSTNVSVDAKTHTMTLSWSTNSAKSGDKTLAKLSFDTAADVFEGDFLHVTIESLSASNEPDKLISGGVEIDSNDIGDINSDGKLNNKDVVTLFRLCSDAKFARKPSFNVSDINRDRSLNNKDVVALFRAVSSGKAIVDDEYIPTTYKENTSRVTNVRTWTFNDGTAGNVIGVYCETEPDCDVIVCDKAGNVLLREKTIDKYFYGRYILPDGKSSETAYIYAKTEDKGWSMASRAVTLAYSSTVGGNAMISHDSHVFLNWYRSFYDGNAVYQGDLNTFFNSRKNYLYAQLQQIRNKTGKNTKIIIIVCTNPATVYHEVQYTEEEGGWGDKYRPTSYSLFAEYMKDDENIYVIDLRDLFEQNKDKRLLFMQADSHWTQIAAYYGYYRAAQKIQKDFPNTKVYDLDKDFNVQTVPSGGDLLNFMGISGVRAATASVTPKSESMYASSDAPTAYVMGDSYYGAIRPHLDLLFSEIYLNNPPSNPPLYDYTLEDLQTKQPDYLVYIWTERNIDANLGYLIDYINKDRIR